MTWEQGGGINCPRHPLVLARAVLSSGHIHDSVAKPKEDLGGQRLREEISHVMLRANKRHANLVRLHLLTHEKVSSLDMLNARMVLRVIRCGNRRLIVYG